MPFLVPKSQFSAGTPRGLAQVSMLTAKRHHVAEKTGYEHGISSAELASHFV